MTDRSPAPWTLLVIFLLAGCDAGPVCDAPETRQAVLKIVSDDHSNPLASYAAKNSDARNSNAAREEVKGRSDPERARPLYLLGQQMVTTSTSDDKRTLQCRGSLSAMVGETKATKEVNFTVQQAPDGKISVSVVPFQF